MASNRKNRPNTVTVKNGALVVEIGADTLAFSALASPFAWEMADQESGKPPATVDPRTLFAVDDAEEFAREIKMAMCEEREDGSSLLTDLLDAATRKAIEDGSLQFDNIAKETPDAR
jgi:hypothetical protein